MNTCARELNSAARAYFKTHGRRQLPWRTEQTPYRVFVSELMLQQTQVDRVVPKFEAFTKKFPSWKALAKASLPEVLTLWVGLGYNRRAKFLHETARIITKQGELTDDLAFLLTLPGVGTYTAGAIRAFAFGNPDPFVETNIRTVALHHCFKKQTGVTDTEILSVLQTIRPKKGRDARLFYAALMDYGAYLKRSGIRLNQKSASYSKQKSFEGSPRQLRGAVVRLLLSKPHTKEELVSATKRKPSEIDVALTSLQKEGLITKRGTRFLLSSRP